MSMVGQSESNDIFVSELKAKELMITGSSDLLSLFQWENKNVDLITMGFLSFGIQINISSDPLCPTPPCKDLTIRSPCFSWFVVVKTRKSTRYGYCILRK